MRQKIKEKTGYVVMGDLTNRRFTMNSNKVCFYWLIIVSVFLFPLVATGATITGTINFDGDVPNFRTIKMDADPICITHHNRPVSSQVLVLGKGNTLGNIFVHVVSGLEKKEYPSPSEPAVLDQKGCIYNPHVMGVMVGQPIKILNPDGTLHNVHAMTKVNDEFNVAMPTFRKELTKIFDKPEFMLAIKCDVHPWMGAYISVMKHPFFAVTNEDGVYAIADLPAGTYELEVWHEKLGTKKVFVNLVEGETKEINFTLSIPTTKN